ncbi:SAM-dependent methyltransferase [Mycobacterium sp. MS1601]|uniref:class I SAM-dependent methyltransferase n=1 Tax=Mycobacterium sp. MS1601 TaxID=1936029 RepID=UPI00097956C1|nr:methyltransferase domain-containing protein [Mycobacterium sp. MS1601]AQA04678.1 SAM-dependent methyltransferase [Mycobacterium sp. MS1601]
MSAFIRAVVRNPQRVGAVTPSSAHLAAQLASVVPDGGTPVVVELGPGTGAVSSAIAERLPSGGRHLAVELDPSLAWYVARRHPSVEVVNGDARELTGLLASRGVATAASVVSGLPWSLFDPATQRLILQQIAHVLGEDGVFTTFAYVHAAPLRGAREFRRILTEMFGDVRIGRVVWRNIPPAYTYRCSTGTPHSASSLA